MIPVRYRNNGEGAIASYDWYDYFAGVGYKKFYCCGSNDNAGAKYFLVTDTSQGSSGEAGFYYTSVGAGTAEQNFDLVINKPFVLSGNAYITYTQVISATKVAYVSVIIYHVDTAAVETSLGTSRIVSHTAGGATSVYRDTLKIACTEKVFGVGDTLRISVSITSNGNTSEVYHDPANRMTHTEDATGATIGSNMIVDIPLKINL